MTINIGENIKESRLKKGITQETLASYLGVSFQSISRWERGDGYPDITLLPSIANFFDITVDSLLGTDIKMKEQKINEYLELYDNMKLKDLQYVFEQTEKAVNEFPGDFRVLVRYMELIQEAKLFSLSLNPLKSNEWEKYSEKITKIFENIQAHCTDDSIRIRSKRVMISHLMWKYDCVCDSDGKYHTNKEYFYHAQKIVDTLPCINDSREINLIHDDSETYYSNNKKAIEELLFLLQTTTFSYCFNYKPEDRLEIFQCIQNLTKLIYKDGDYGKNSINMLYNYGHIGQLYHQIGDNKNALINLRYAAEYASLLDSEPETTQKIMRHHNYGQIYRETTLCEFMKTVMTEHYNLSEEFKSTGEFKTIIEYLTKN